MIEENEKITKKEGYFKMNKKSLLMMMVTICLIAVVGVGATLAYLSDSTGALTNTFTFVQKGIEITLDEAPVDNNYKAIEGENRIEAGVDEEGNPKGNNYDALVPGAVMDKDPTVTVESGSVDCYVVVSVKNPSADLLVIGGKDVEVSEGAWANVNWEEVKVDDPEANVKYYAYKEKVTKNLQEKALVVFEKVTFNNEYEAKNDSGEFVETTLSPIVIKAAAVQANEIEKNAAITEAISMLKEN